MNKKKFVKFFFIFLLFLISIGIFNYKFYANKKINIVEEDAGDTKYNSNIIKDVEYTTKDKNGNEYFITAREGEIDFSSPNIIFLTEVYALIKLTDRNEVTILSDFGKYNSENYDTIFSKNVIINYLNNKITGEYLDFSLERNLMTISKNVIYSNPENILKADVIELNIITKDTKIFMHNSKDQVNIESRN